MSAKAPPLSEKDLQAAVVRRAQALGWRVMAVRKSSTRRRGDSYVSLTPWLYDGKGFPDLLLVRGDRMVCAELKVGANRPSAEQKAWRDALAAVPGVEAHVWYSGEWFDGTVERVLSWPSG